jgi:hypothetical protein
MKITYDSLGRYKGEMELFLHTDPTTRLLSDSKNGCGSIEWTVEELDICEHIGVWWEDGKIIDYDGVFEFPKEAAKLMKKFGVTTPKNILN